MSSKKLATAVVARIAAVLFGVVVHESSTEGAPASSASACSGAMPLAVATPPGHEVAFELLAQGVQIYACAEPPGGASGAPAWALQAPEATLLEPGGPNAGTHRAGPTWEALDGSSVLGVKVEAATADPSAIPWLLLRATTHHGAGRMADVTFIQRVATSGGVAPPQGCRADTVGAIARVPYHAVYCFYRAAADGPGGEGAASRTSRGARP